MFEIKSYNSITNIVGKSTMLNPWNRHILDSLQISFFIRNKKFLIPRIAKFIRESKYNLLNKIFFENISGDFSHAEDICKGIYKLALSKKNPDKLIFSSNKRTFINDIINYLLNLSNIKIKFSKIKKKKYLSPLGDNSLTRKELNWSLKKNIFIAAKELIKTNI